MTRAQLGMAAMLVLLLPASANSQSKTEAHTIRKLRPRGARRATIMQDGIRASHALASLARQTGNPVALAKGAPDRLLSLSVDGKYYFQALSAICQAGGYRAGYSPAEGHLLSPGKPPAYPTMFDGPFRIRVLGVTRVWSRDLDGLDRTGYAHLNVRLRIDWGRGFHFVGYVWPKVTAARDDHGRTLIRKDGGERDFIGSEFDLGPRGLGSAPGGAEVSLFLEGAPLQARHLTSLAGSVTLVFIEEAHIVLLPDPHKLRQQKLAVPGGFYEFRGLVRELDLVKLHTRWSLPLLPVPGAPWKFSVRRRARQTWNFLGQYLIDEKGIYHNWGGGHWSDGPPVESTLSYELPDRLRISALELHYATRTLIRRISFDFKNLPLR